MNTQLKDSVKDLDHLDSVVSEILKHCVDILLKKRGLYGTNNISGFGLYGLCVRMHDKLSRIINIVENKLNTEDADESIEDNLVDLLNYSLISLLFLFDKWELEENAKKGRR